MCLAPARRSTIYRCVCDLATVVNYGERRCLVKPPVGHYFMKFHELKVYINLFGAIVKQRTARGRVTALILQDLSVAFDRTDYSTDPSTPLSHLAS